MSDIFEMISNALDRNTIAWILDNDELKALYVLHERLSLITNFPDVEAITEHIAGLPSVASVRAKAELKQPITLAELDACIVDVSRVNRYVGWVLEDGAADVRKLLAPTDRTAPHAASRQRRPAPRTTPAPR